MKKLLAVVLIALVAMSLSARAATVTNQGQVITVTKLSETADAGTVMEDQSVYATPANRLGLIVAECTVPSDTTSLDFGPTVPKGAILLENGVIECSTTVATATNVSIAVGSITVLAGGSALSSGISAAVASPGITTSADRLTLTIAGDAATAGKFMVYLPYILGNASR